MIRITQSKTRLRYLFSFLLILLFVATASAQSIVSTEYGNGWQKITYSNGISAYSNQPTYLRYDNVWIPEEWLNIENGNWSYKVSEIPEDEYHPASFVFTADGKDITIPKANTKFNLGLFKISPSLTYSKAKLISNMVNVNTTVAYLVFPYSLSQIRDYADEHNIKVGRWMFQAGQEHIDIYDDVVINHTRIDITGQTETYQAVTTLDKAYYQFRIVNGEIRLYFLKAEANKLNGNITFALNSWIVGGEGGNAWFGNSSYNNFMLDRNTNHIILPDVVTNGLVLYQKMSGSSGITSYDMNTTSNNTGTLTNMNTGLDNGSSGWNSSGKFGNAIAFDGVNDYIYIPPKNYGSISEWSEGLWINISSFIPNGYARLIANWNPGFILALANLGNIRIYSWDNEEWSTTTTNVVPLNTWTHVFFTWNGTTGIVNIYINGILVKSSTSTTNTFLLNQFIKLSDPSNSQFNGSMDDIRVYNRVLTNNEINQTMNNTMLTSGNLTTWYNAGTGNETYQVDVNATTPTNTNYTIWYANNGTGSYSQLGGTLTGNNSLTITTKYQNTDVQVRLAGNTTSTSEIIKVTFWTQEIPPAIISWGNDYTNNNITSFSAAKNVTIVFNATADHTITTWNWTGATQINGTGSTNSYAQISYLSPGIYEVSVNGTNAYGITNTITWTVTVLPLCCLNISGYVTNVIEYPLQNARVDFNSTHIFTDAAGYYEFTGIEEGTYQVLARATGYRNHTDILNIAGNTTLNITLTERTFGTVTTPGFSAISGIFIIAVTLILVRKTKRSD